MNSIWTRRAWLTRQIDVAVLVTARLWEPRARTPWSPATLPPATAACVAAHARRLDQTTWQTFAQRAVDAARSAGAQYADARLTRTVQHIYGFDAAYLYFSGDEELLGVGVRALVDGFWGFAACPRVDATTVVQLAQQAVVLARTNAIGPHRSVEMGTVPGAVGTWATPVRIDPFTIPIEEKCDLIRYWKNWAQRCGGSINVLSSHLHFVRQERVVATSDGTCVTQTIYESDGAIEVSNITPEFRGGFAVQGLTTGGRGWEMVLDAKIPDQIETNLRQIQAEIRAHPTPTPPSRTAAEQVEVGRYTLVCDGATMGSLLEQTLGRATQLDRALGYEANAGGTSFIDDPLAMVGHLQVGSPLVTVTANRSSPTHLATVRWDDEGVEPTPFTVVQDGRLTDFQTTREQAAWLAPYTQAHGRPVQSHGCAAAESALFVTMQHMPNLALEPNPAEVRLDDLIADVKEGILITDGDARADFQARNGFLRGTMHKITNGRVGAPLSGGTVRFNTMDLWTHVVALGGPATHALLSSSQYHNGALLGANVIGAGKGQPWQTTSHTVSAVAATIANQAVINLTRKA